MLFYEQLLKGGPVMWPIFALSAATLSCALDRAWFWFRLLSQEDRIVRDVMAAAYDDLQRASSIAEQAIHLPIGRFLAAPLQLRQPTPETFRLALEAAGDKEFIQMRRGDKLLETVIAMAPLLGLLGTVTGLINTFSNLTVGGGAASEEATLAAAGIGEALITTAAGMVVAIVALLFFRVFVSLQAQQIDYFAEVGNELELVYRQIWFNPVSLESQASSPASPLSPLSSSRPLDSTEEPVGT